MRRIRSALIGAIALGAVGLVTLNGSAASSEGGRKSFTLFERVTENGAVNQHGSTPTVGDSFALSSDLFTNSTASKKVGHAGVTCTVTSVTRGLAGEVECSFTSLLAGGQISTTGLVDLATALTPGGKFSLPVVGGTGRYRDARGEVDVEVINGTDSKDTFELN